ncbi:MAG: hypothetical protein UZ19_OD1000847 [Parcubacteria bacterium OLB19]|nr:MAG: hypothetical protein UZ19_OD1000847 [Parcubacteria bacterium OLB19]
MDQKIKIAVRDFSETPGPREKVQGDFSAELFVETVLNPEFQKMDSDPALKMEINLDGTLGYGTSFLEEVFGGTARKKGVAFVRDRIEIISNEEPWLKEEIKTYVDDVEKHDQMGN